MTLTSSLFAGLFLLLPMVFMWMTGRYGWANKLGIVALCYLAGLLLGNSGWLPARATAFQEQLTEVSIAIALPMLMMSLNVGAWLRNAGKAIVSMLLATTAVVTVATLLSVLLTSPAATPDAAPNTQLHAQLAAMAVGVYTGGTPNLAAIQAGLDIPRETYLVFHSLDTLLGALYLTFMLTLGVRVFRWGLPAQPSTQAASMDSNPGQKTPELNRFDDHYQDFLKWRNVPQLLAIFGLSVAVVATALLLSERLEETLGIHTSGALTIILLTSLGLALSLVPTIRQLSLSYKLGMYWVYVFCFTVASMANYQTLITIDPMIAVYIVAVLSGSIGLHACLCRWLQIDSHTFMVTSVAAICSPPFVPLIAKTLNNSSLILSGMTTGILGYALGNYIGISLALILQAG